MSESVDFFAHEPICYKKHSNFADGLYNDLMDLFRTFQTFSSVRFYEFASIWREMKMSMICYGRQTESECSAFLAEAFNICTSMLKPINAFEIRVAALYTLYALYHTQPLLPKVKIRITLSQCLEILNIKKSSIDAGHLDILYIIHSLFLSSVFLFAAYPREIFPERFAKSEMANRGRLLNPTSFIANAPVKTVFTERSLETLALLHEEYEQAKRSVANSHTSVDVPQELSLTFIPDVLSLLANYEDSVSGGSIPNEPFNFEPDKDEVEEVSARDNDH